MIKRKGDGFLSVKIENIKVGDVIYDRPDYEDCYEFKVKEVHNNRIVLQVLSKIGSNNKYIETSKNICNFKTEPKEIWYK